MRLEFPGGGGYGAPHDRAVDRVLDDVVNGYVSIDAAREVYGVAVDYVGPPDAMVRPPESYRVDQERTRVLRGPGALTPPDGPEPHLNTLPASSPGGCLHGQGSAIVSAGRASPPPGRIAPWNGNFPGRRSRPERRRW